MSESAGAQPVRITQRRRIPEDMKQTVTVLYRPDPNSATPLPVGTGFLIRYPSVTRPAGAYSLIVTARHVVTDERGQLIPGLSIRVNRRGGGVELLAVPGEDVFLHSDPTVDLCVLPGGLDRSAFEYRELSVEFFPPRETLRAPQLGEGIDVVYLSLFVLHPGETANQPIARFGRVAMVPTERVFWEEDFHELLLIEAFSYGGSSGAPVFAFLDGISGARLLGVLKGSFREVAVKVQDVLLAAVNGVSAVTPAYLLEDMLQTQVIPALDRTMP